MIRTTAVPRSAVAAASVLGVIALAGCGASTSGTASDPAGTPAAETPATGSTASTAAGGSYTDGTYTADGSYVDGGGVAETVTVTITIADDVVTDVGVTGNAASPQSRQYQSAFIGGIADVVEGKKLNDLSVSKVAGSSLTSGGFNDALAKIKAEAGA